MRCARVFAFIALGGALCVCRAQLQPAMQRTHDSTEWTNIAEHLPDPASTSPERLEQVADVLRARRYPADALQFYNAALARNGAPLPLLKKMGIVCMEMQQISLSRAYFQRAVNTDKRNPGAWNNLGAAQYLLHNDHASVRAYKRAIKLDQGSAVYHANLALVYFDGHHAEDGRRELSRALALDPDLLRRDPQGGDTARVLATTTYPQICFEMARVYAAQGNTEAMLDWLTKASDRGFNVQKAMDADAALRPLLADVRVKALLHNEQTLRAAVRPMKVPSLGPANGTP